MKRGAAGRLHCKNICITLSRVDISRFELPVIVINHVDWLVWVEKADDKVVNESCAPFFRLNFTHEFRLWFIFDDPLAILNSQYNAAASPKST